MDAHRVIKQPRLRCRPQAACLPCTVVITTLLPDAAVLPRRHGTVHFVHVGRHPNPATPLAYAKVTMGSVAEAERVVQSLDGMPLPQLAGSNELIVKFGRVAAVPSTAAAAMPRTQQQGPAGSQRAHSSGGGSDTHQGGASAANGAGGSAAGSAASSVSGAPPALAAHRCGSCGLRESPDLALRRCSACKAVACEHCMGGRGAPACGLLLLCSSTFPRAQLPPGSHVSEPTF